jgi:hypothetical protein
MAALAACWHDLTFFLDRNLCDLCRTAVELRSEDMADSHRANA